MPADARGFCSPAALREVERNYPWDIDLRQHCPSRCITYPLGEYLLQAFLSSTARPIWLVLMRFYHAISAFALAVATYGSLRPQNHKTSIMQGLIHLVIERIGARYFATTLSPLISRYLGRPSMQLQETRLSLTNRETHLRKCNDVADLSSVIKIGLIKMDQIKAEAIALSYTNSSAAVIHAHPSLPSE